MNVRAVSVKRVAIAVVLFASSVAGAVDLTECGQHVSPGSVAIVQNDIDCTGSPERLAAVYLGDQATLQLNGHTITARSDIDGVVGDVARRCAIIGPGVITGAATGIVGAKTRMTITSVTLTGNRNAIDLPLGRLDLIDVTSSSTFAGISGGDIRATRLAVTTNSGGNCIMGSKLRGVDVTVTGCHTGITMLRSVRVEGLDDRDNLTVGVTATRVRLINSVVTGNIFIGQALDILSRRRPVLTNTTCDASAQWINDTVGPAWGVCAGD